MLSSKDCDKKIISEFEIFRKKDNAWPPDIQMINFVAQGFVGARLSPYISLHILFLPELNYYCVSIEWKEK